MVWRVQWRAAKAKAFQFRNSHLVQKVLKFFEKPAAERPERCAMLGIAKTQIFSNFWASSHLGNLTRTRNTWFFIWFAFVVKTDFGGFTEIACLDQNDDSKLTLLLPECQTTSSVERHKQQTGWLKNHHSRKPLQKTPQNAMTEQRVFSLCPLDQNYSLITAYLLLILLSLWTTTRV